MKIRVQKREETESSFSLLILAISLLGGLVAVGIVFAVNRVNPFYAL